LQALLVIASLKGDGPANDTKLGVHILPLAFPWTLAMIRKVATILGPAAPSFPDQDGVAGI